MSNFKGDYLRVMSPVTTNGVIPKMVSGQMQWKEDHLPVTARKALEKRNLKLPEHLRKKIELVPAYVPPVKVQPVEQPEEVQTKSRR